jgi:hypothetical protein
MFVFQTMYTTTVKGSVLSDDASTPGVESLRIVADSQNRLSENVVVGTISQVRPPNALASNRLYRSGFGSNQLAAGVTPSPFTVPVNFEIFGGLYIAPPTDALAATGLLDIPLTTGADNARLVFSESGVLAPNGTGTVTTQTGGTAPSVTVTVAARGRATVKPYDLVRRDNLARTTLTAVAGTGAFSGTFRLTDSDPTSRTAPAIVRSSSFQGLIVRSRQADNSWSTEGVGYFLLDTLPTVNPPTTRLTSPRTSGLVIFERNPR